MIPRAAAGLALAACLAAPFLLFRGTVSTGEFKTILALASLAWFAFGTVAIYQRR